MVKVFKALSDERENFKSNERDNAGEISSYFKMS